MISEAQTRREIDAISRMARIYQEALRDIVLHWPDASFRALNALRDGAAVMGERIDA